MRVHSGRLARSRFRLVLSLLAFNCDRLLGATTAQHGLTAGELMRGVGLFAAIAGILILFLVEFLWRPRLQPSTYRWLLFVGLLLLPITILLGVTTTLFEETKTVGSCASCHVMDPFVNDMMDPESPTLAAGHFRNKWISDHQCYACHTTYGVHGTLAAKRDGFRHWWLYVTGTWNKPIQYSGSYPNSNCRACHEGTVKFEEVKSHQALWLDLETDRLSCFSCHGPPHPGPKEQEVSAGNQ
ncbi:NapC/NirT family cytochrome c [Acidobacteria bacterium AH-259-L09]|nr:NapC/NirT family cytochrome c [Acidobacteria bacterium AH-259-L09]